MTFRLHSRIVLWNILIVGLISAILGYYLIHSLREGLHRQVESLLLNETALGAAYLSETDALRSPDEGAGKLAQLLNRRVTIIAEDGRVLGDSEVEAASLESVENHRFRPEVQQALAVGTGAATRFSPTVHTEFIYVARKLDRFVLRLAMPLSEIDTLVRDLRSQLILAMLIALGLTLVFGYLIRGLISRPLRHLATASQKLAAGNLQQRLPITGDEEIAALGASLNTMAQNLSATVNELTEGKQRLESILAGMGEGVMVLNSTGRITLTNNSVRDLLGSDRDVSGKSLLEVFRRPALESAVRNVLSGGSREVLEFIAGNGRMLQANIAPVPNLEGQIDSIVVVFHDLSDIRRTERMRRDFVANVSHEFKTPLTSIRGYAETLLAGAREDPQIAQDFLKIIERNARHLEALVTDLLTLARLESELPLLKEEIDVCALISEQVAAREAALKSRNISLVTDCTAVQLLADRGRLSTALSNLIDNAIAYNRSGGEIRIAAHLKGDVLELVIADTGQGIPGEELPRIFERFYRVDKARSRESGGTGLGLAIVKHAIESQGGSITVTSRFGAGSTFTIRLPAA